MFVLPIAFKIYPTWIYLRILDFLKDFNSIFIGTMTKKYARDSDTTEIVQLTFLFQPERHQATLDKLHVLMQRFPRVIRWMFMNQNFLWVSSNSKWSTWAMITFGTKYLNNMVYTLVNLVLNTLKNLVKFYFWFLTVIHIVKVYLVQSERPVLTVTIIFN